MYFHPLLISNYPSLFLYYLILFDQLLLVEIKIATVFFLFHKEKYYWMTQEVQKKRVISHQIHTK